MLANARLVIFDMLKIEIDVVDFEFFDVDWVADIINSWKTFSKAINSITSTMIHLTIFFNQSNNLTIKCRFFDAIKSNFFRRNRSIYLI